MTKFIDNSFDSCIEQCSKRVRRNNAKIEFLPLVPKKNLLKQTYRQNDFPLVGLPNS